MTDKKPLVLDVDGTFLRTDMLLECFWAGLGRDPLATLRASATMLGHPARLKAELAGIADLRTDQLPVNDGVMAEVRKAQDEGREVMLDALAGVMATLRGQAHALADRPMLSRTPSTASFSTSTGARKKPPSV